MVRRRSARFVAVRRGSAPFVIRKTAPKWGGWAWEKIFLAQNALLIMGKQMINSDFQQLEKNIQETAPFCSVRQSHVPSCCRPLVPFYTGSPGHSRADKHTSTPHCIIKAIGFRMTQKKEDEGQDNVKQRPHRCPSPWLVSHPGAREE